MKALKLTFRDMNLEDSLQFGFEGAYDPSAELEHELEPFLQSLESYAGDWMPDVIGGKRKRRYSRAAIWKALGEARGPNTTDVWFYRTSPPVIAMQLWLMFSSRPPKLDITFDVQPLSFWGEAQRCRNLVDLVRAWASRYPVTYASAHSMADKQLAGAPFFGRDEKVAMRDGFDKIYEVFWLNVFGPRLVETVGRERMLSTPGFRVEELPSGAVLLVTAPIAAEFASEPARQAQARAFAHLRPDLDFDTVLHTLRQRSATLAPVEPRFHPDMAALLPRLLDDFAISERQRRIAEWNEWQPPEPEEWLPAAAALPPDVEDTTRALEVYDHLAERLVALLHTDVPSVLGKSPESLTDIDSYFWHEDFPKSRLREAIDQHAVPAVGAYLGEMLVRHMGGRWIPRQKLDEAQVVVGDRAWLPMRRARNYLRSLQTLLDCSLTQLYRVAERHRSPRASN